MDALWALAHDFRDEVTLPEAAGDYF